MTAKAGAAEERRATIAAMTPQLLSLYSQFHQNPEVAGDEHKTAEVLAVFLEEIDGEVIRGIGGCGVVAILRNGVGPTVLLRAEMDALPTVVPPGGDAPTVVPAGSPTGGTRITPVHACGHDANMVALAGTIAFLDEHRDRWVGTAVAVFQPAEETGQGAAAMLEDGLLTRFARPDICLAQHVTALPVGVITTRSGTMMAAADTLLIRLYGRGGHSSSPEATVDPVVMAAAVVGRLQGVVSREVANHESAVVTVSAIHAGAAENVIPDFADLTVNIRTFTEAVRDRVIAAIRRIIAGEALASNADRDPLIIVGSHFPRTINDNVSTAMLMGALAGAGFHAIELPAPMSASEDFGAFAAAIGCPSVYWTWGGTSPSRFSQSELAELSQGVFPPHIAGNHSPQFAPDAVAALAAGTLSFTVAAESWLNSSRHESDPQ